MVMAGYKKTVVGIVPEDWEINTIESASERIGDVDHRMPQSVDYGIPYIMTGDFFGVNGMNFAKAKKISTEDFYLLSRKIRPEKGDIIFARYASIGAVRYVETERPFIISYSCVIIKPSASCNAVYLYYIFQSASMQKQINFAVNTGTQKNVGIGSLKNFFLPLPQYSEQTAIANALSDVDAYIAALEKLIAKKRAIKQGAMQELLTGKRRLPGFEGEWVEKPLREVALDIRTGKKNNEDKTSNGNYPFFVRSQQVETIDSYSYDGEAIIVPGEGNIGEIFHYIVGKFDFHQRVYKVSDFAPDYCGKYVYYQMKMSFGKHALENTSKATVDSLRLPVFHEFMVNLPPTKGEQEEIAIVLSDMDAEIDALTAKLNKAKYIKQGMMSELLTGRIRLVEQEAPAEPVAAPKVVELPKQEAKGHNQQFDDAVMIAGIVNALYSDKFPLGRKKVQKCLYLLRRHQDESTEAFKKKAAGPYADEVRYKGGEPIARSANYIVTTTTKDKGTTFARGKNISQALGYIESWGKQDDIKWVADKLKFKKVDELELLATVDMAICDLEEAGTPVSVAAIKHLIATNAEWKAKLKRQIFSDANIARAIRELQTLLQGGN
ncbi:restriction endonuclease subunit S [Paradesulfitobacterium ferrireducens]|uniref:restriction endonuclease subunit S n=1 Tax=Paradesulfitobacterium ferrireducens TaxID=2816476 RepID=UPI001A907F84|nr:restriction endonuclease subunit S [Paradesulfitobacterium ferrireducens]